MLELLKVIVQPVILERDESGKIIGEQAVAPQPLYSVDEVADFFALIEGELEKQNAPSLELVNGDD